MRDAKTKISDMRLVAKYNNLR